MDKRTKKSAGIDAIPDKAVRDLAAWGMEHPEESDALRKALRDQHVQVRPARRS